MKPALHITSTGARLLCARRGMTGLSLVKALNLPQQRPVILLNGGAADLSAEFVNMISQTLALGLAPLWTREAITIIDGGTQSGTMQIIGEVRQRYAITAPLVGVCLARRVAWPDESNHTLASLDPYHSHFVLAPGIAWGEETPVMFALADAITGNSPSLALLANGGAGTKQEMLWNIRCGREIVILRNSGRLADHIADVYLGVTPPHDDQIATIVQHGRITVFDPLQGPTAFASLLTDRLGYSV